MEGKVICPSLTADCIRRMYPAVDESITPLPRQWSTKDKSSILGLSQNNLVVHYKGLLLKAFQHTDEVLCHSVLRYVLIGLTQCDHSGKSKEPKYGPEKTQKKTRMSLMQ